MNENLYFSIIDALTLVNEQLSSFTEDYEFQDKLILTFGNSINSQVYQQLWNSPEFNLESDIEVRSQSELNGAIGAFSRDTGKIYLSDSFLNQNANNLGAIADLILEEYGHKIDAEVNPVEFLGDEGRIFARLVQGEKITAQELQALQSEDDTGTIILDEQIINIEQAFVSWIGGSGDWYDGSNWSTGVVPSAEDRVTISAVRENLTITFSQGNPTVSSLQLYAQHGGTLDVSALTDLSLMESGLGNIIQSQDDGSFIDLSGLTEISNSRTLAIGVLGGGEIDLSNLVSINTRSTGIGADGTNSVINLSSLESFANEV